MDMNKKIGSCGLACMQCRDKIKGECEGCITEKAKHCKIKACCHTKNIEGCYGCSSFPCDQFTNKRVRAFATCVQEMGMEQLVACLERNEQEGIKYHPEDGSMGDYDLLDSEEAIKNLIKRGRQNE